MKTKRCNVCHRAKPLSEYYPLRDGLHSYCKKCNGKRPVLGCWYVKRVHPDFFTVHAPSFLEKIGRLVATAATRAEANAIKKRLMAEAVAS